MDCILVDDSLLARKALSILLSQVNFLVLKKECSSSLEAFNYLKTENVDLMFLDVEMPEMSGIELLRNLKIQPIIIIISAKRDYALDAFELNVADYLLKPVNPERLMFAIDRAKEIYDGSKNTIEESKNDKEYIFVRSDSALNRIKLSEILYIQALGDYVKIYTLNKHYLVHCTLKSMEEKLSAIEFFRLHRSYIIGINHIEKIDEDQAYVGKHPVPIGEAYKKELLSRINVL